MKPSLTKLLDVILKRIEEQPDVPHTENGMRTWLLGLGYSKRDVEAALKLVGPRMEAPGESVDHRPATVRVYSPVEYQKLSPEARQALERLDFYNLIDPAEREMMLDRLNHFEGQVDVEELDFLLSWAVLSARDVESQQTIYDVFEGNADTFH